MPGSGRRRRHHVKQNVYYGPKNYVSRVDREVSLLLYPDPDGCPYERSNFEQALEERELLGHVCYVLPKKQPNLWVMVLKTAEDKRIVAKVAALCVNQRYCAVVDPSLKETTIKVHWVPFNVTNEAIRQMFEQYGVVKEVIHENCIEKGFEDKESTTWHISICLEKEFFKRSIPHLRNISEERVCVFIPGRQPRCLKCLTVRRGDRNVRRKCKRCPTCGTYGPEDERNALCLRPRYDLVETKNKSSSIRRSLQAKIPGASGERRGAVPPDVGETAEDPKASVD